MSKRSWTLALRASLFAAVFFGWLAGTSFAASITLVTINTSAIAGTSGSVAFDFVVDNPPEFNHVEILNFSAPGSTTTLPQTQGGLVEGDLLLPPFNTGSFTEIHGGSFFNELLVNFTSFGSSISFTVQMTEFAPGPGGLPDQFALYLLDSNGLPLFPTDDPLGANALFIVDITGAAGGVRTVYQPATITGNQLSLVVPGADGPNPDPIPEPGSLSLLGLGIAGLWKQRRRRRSHRG